MKNFLLITSRNKLHEKVPQKNYKDNILIEGNIRIDNSIYIKKNEQLSSELSDRDLIYCLYQKYGRDFIKRIHGCFSFFIHDVERKNILAFRDEFGQSSLFYSFEGKKILIASSIKDILNEGILDKKMNIDRVIDFIAHTHSTTNETFFQNIFKLEPSNELIITKDTDVKQLYECFEIEDNTKKNLRELFYDSIRSIITSNTGSMLSGGIDSSSISIASQKISNKPLETFSIIFPNLKPDLKEIADEEKYIDEVLKNKNLSGNKIKVDEFNFIQNIKENVHFIDEPIMATNIYIYEKVFIEMSKKNVASILDGTDGDSVLSHGTEIFRDFGEKNKLKDLINSKRAYDLKRGAKFSLFKTIFSFVLLPRIPDFLKKIINLVRGRDYFDEQNKLLAMNFRKSKSEMKKNVEKLYYTDKKFESFASKAHYMMIYKSHWDEVFNILNQIAGKHNIEIKFPFFYKPLVSFCLDSGAEEKLKEGTTRYYFKEAMKDDLPDIIYKRNTKADLSPIFKKEFMNLDESYVNEVFFDKKSPIYALIEQSRIKKLLQSKNHKKNLSIIYSLISLYEWMKKNHFSVVIEK
tara:strand:- start:269 stop:2002 length:1734 start_codon:yes stop_codon:yes gene_type:complete